MNTTRLRATTLAGCTAVLLGVSGCGWGGGPDEPVGVAGDNGITGDRAGIAGDDGDVAAPPAALPPDPAPVLDIAELTGVHTRLTVDPAFKSTINALGLTVGAVGAASVEQDTVTFPITGGQLRADGPAAVEEASLQGHIEHQGSGLSLSAGGTSVRLTDLVLDPDEDVVRGTVALGERVLAEQVPLLALTGGTLEPAGGAGPADTATLSGATVRLNENAVGALAAAFGITALDPSTSIGTARVTVALPPS